MKNVLSKQAELPNSTYKNDEINLLELFNILWLNKTLMIGFTLLFLALGIMSTYLTNTHSKTPVQRWVSYAEVLPPNASDIATLLYKMRLFNALNVTKASIFNDLSSSIDVSEKLFENFIKEASSSLQHSEFARDKAYFEALTANLEGDPLALSRQASGSGVFDVSTPPKSANTPPPPTTIKFTSSVQNVAQKVLTDYIKQVSNDIINKENNDLNSLVQASIHALEHQLQDEVLIAENKKRTHLLQLTYALNVAQNVHLSDMPAQIVLPVETNQLYLLGEKLLSAQIKALKSAPSSQTEQYYIIQHKIDALTQLLILPITDRAYTFRVDPSTEYSISSGESTGAKRIIIWIVAAALGFMLASMFVLMRHLYRVRH